MGLGERPFAALALQLPNVTLSLEGLDVASEDDM
jgi:hypothetical protein